jgi:hypothetical protein
MSLIEENYQDEQGNWLPEAQAILAKATATTATNKGTHALFPMNEGDDCEPPVLLQEIKEKVETP